MFRGMFPSEFTAKPAWWLYDTTTGNVVLKHFYLQGMTVRCPHCGLELTIKDYKAECCGRTFRTGFGEIAQREPVGKHTKTSGRGWASLRPYLPNAGDCRTPSQPQRGGGL
jgi:hypothetical protein